MIIVILAVINIVMFDVENLYSEDCFNYDCESFKTVPMSCKDIMVLNYNIRSFNKNSDEFLGFVQHSGTLPDVFCLTETWCGPQSLAKLDGCESIYSGRSEVGGSWNFCQLQVWFCASKQTHVCNRYD